MARPAWLVLDMDDGLLRREPTRAAAVAWAVSMTGVRVLRRHAYGPGAYEYVLGLPGDDPNECWFVEREDITRWDAKQVALYPDDDHPFRRVERERAATRSQDAGQITHGGT